jgi:hypothetical protein
MTTLALLRERYATCARYSDRGSSVKVYVRDYGTRKSYEPLTFRTEFDRASGLFRFEYDVPGRHRAVISREDQGDAQLWWSVQPAVRTGPLQSLIAAQTGVSNGVAANPS